MQNENFRRIRSVWLAGLNNTDIAGVQLEVLKADPKKVMERYGNRSAGSKCRRNVSVPSGERS